MLSQSYVIRQKPTRDIPLILVVDDNVDNVMFATGSLELLNLKFIVAHNGESATKIAIESLPDLILLDVVMPGMNGIAVTQILKQNLITKEIPIIAVTGLVYDNQQQEIMEAGFDDYLRKPYLIEELSSKLARFLDYKTVSIAVS